MDPCAILEIERISLEIERISLEIEHEKVYSLRTPDFLVLTAGFVYFTSP